MSTGASRAEVATHGDPKLKKCVFINLGSKTTTKKKASPAVIRQ
jgi:hypothetical protein